MLWGNFGTVTPNSACIYMAGSRSYSATSREEAISESLALRSEMDAIPWLTYRKNFLFLSRICALILVGVPRFGPRRC